jgi:hypothetical protein
MLTDTGKAAAKAITDALLHGGLAHPDNPKIALTLPGFATTGHIPEIAQQIEATADVIARAIITLITGPVGAHLLDSDELAEHCRIQTAQTTNPQTVTVTCRHGQLLTFDPTRPLDCRLLVAMINHHIHEHR